MSDLRELRRSWLTTTDGRRAGWCWGERPRCTNNVPKEHQLKSKEPVLTEAIVTCHHVHSRGMPECGQRLYVRKVPRIGDEAQSWFVCEVTAEHIRRLRTEPMQFLQVMAILGCVLPGVDNDVGGELARGA